MEKKPGGFTISARAISRKKRIPLSSALNTDVRPRRRGERAISFFFFSSFTDKQVPCCLLRRGDGRLNTSLVSRNSETRPPRKFRAAACHFFCFDFFFSSKIEFSSHPRISQRPPSFLQIAPPRYRIGNFRNLSLPPDDLLPAQRPFDTANALDRSMHSTSLRSIDTSDTLHRDV